MVDEHPSEFANVEILHAAVEAFRRREITYRDILEDLPAAIYTVDSDGRLTYFNKACIALSGRLPVLGEDQWCIMKKLYSTDGELIAPEQCAVALAVTSDLAMDRVEVIGERPDGSRVNLIAYPTAIINSNGECLGAVDMLVDVTDQKRAQERLMLLAREVDHRSNNLLTLVQSLARLTKAETVEDYKTAIEARLTALADANRLVAKARWENVELRDLVEVETSPFADRRVTVDGTLIALSPMSAQYLGMAIHELCTNAVKYGALSVTEGQVAVSWAIDDGGSLMMVWEETGGPPTEEIPGSGTGNAVINAAIHYLGGEIFRDWRPEGLRCTIMCKAEAL